MRLFLNHAATVCWSTIRSIPIRIWLVFAATGIFVWFLIFGNKGLYELGSIYQMKRGLINKKVALDLEKQGLLQEMENLNNPQYVKHLIHRELGFVDSNEMVIPLKEKTPLDTK